MNKLTWGAIAAALLVLAGVAGFYVYQHVDSLDRTPRPALQSGPTPTAAPAPADAAPAAPAVRYPIASIDPAENAAGDGDDGSATAADPVSALETALVALLGRPSVLSMLQLDALPHRLVATVDNLGRDHAAPRLWPVVPAPGRFTAPASNGTEVIGPANHARYGAFVAFASALDTRRLVGVYVRFYPQFQRAYEELGHPHGHFNDRLVDVLDSLLATPEPQGPIAVRLTEVKGPMQPTRPWVLYEFADPRLEALPAGQKMLLRMSAADRQQLKSQLREIRRQVSGTR